MYKWKIDINDKCQFIVTFSGKLQLNMGWSTVKCFPFSIKLKSKNSFAYAMGKCRKRERKRERTKRKKKVIDC